MTIRDAPEAKNLPPTRINIVNVTETWGIRRERASGAKELEQFVDEALYAIHFAAGQSYGNQENYKDALPHFKAALQRMSGSAMENADLQYLRHPGCFAQLRR